ncbi:cysteine-rich repeat secretory protein 55-like [Aristolochia californica]|uniref:cysteine-rich repeat secretory protein 55-like n=1 Tax=Aristolochia californica TaxID=171875 RepID=UPI0035E1DC17
MASFHLLSPLLFLLPLFLPATSTSPPPLPPSLLAFNCSSSSPFFTAAQAKQILNTLQQNLTSRLSTTHYAAASISHHGELPFVHTFLQCRPHLSTTQCTRCAQAAVEAMVTVCSSSGSVSAWFDYCYIHYYYTTSSASSSQLPLQVFTFRASRTDSPDHRRFDPALNTLLPRLRAETRLATHQGFSAGEIVYGDGLPIFASMECLQFLTPDECDSCLVTAVMRTHRCCGGSHGATVIAGNCRLRFETYRFFAIDGWSGSNSGEQNAIYEEREDGKSRSAVKIKIIWIWCACFVCTMGFSLSYWVLRRRVAFTSKVGSLPVEPTK